MEDSVKNTLDSKTYLLAEERFKELGLDMDAGVRMLITMFANKHFDLRLTLQKEPKKIIKTQSSQALEIKRLGELFSYLTGDPEYKNVKVVHGKVSKPLSES